MSFKNFALAQLISRTSQTKMSDPGMRPRRSRKSIEED